jgi:hypothetical protein
MNAIQQLPEDGISIRSGSDGFSISSSRVPGGAGAGDESQLMGSSADGSRGTDDANKNKGSTNASASAPLVHYETTKLLRARMNMILVLLISTFVTAFFCHRFVKNEEHDDFADRVCIYIKPRGNTCSFPHDRV